MNAAKRYRALVGLSYPTDADVIKRLREGEDIPFEKRGEKRVEAGEAVDDLPEESVLWLLEQGAIEIQPSASAGSGKGRKA